MKLRKIVAVFPLVLMCSQGFAQTPPQPEQPKPPLSFFVTSVGTGKGADLGWR